MKIILIIVFILISSCSTNKVVKNHGTSFIKNKSKDLVVNKSNKNDSNSNSHSIITPMAGVVLKIIKNKGDAVSKGDDLFVVESMKMEQIIKSDYDGIVDAVNVDANEQVSAGKILMTIS